MAEGGETIENDTEPYRRVLDKCRRKFVDDLEPIALLDVFVEEDYITNTQERDIKELGNTSSMNRRILHIVRPKGITGYIQFKTYLRTSRQEYLADHLESTENQLIGTTIKDENNAQTVTKTTGYTCTVCDVAYETVELLVQHTKTMEHLDLIQKQETFAKEIEEDSTEDSNDMSDLSSINEENVFDSSVQVSKCYICDVSFTSSSHADSHLSGKPHKKRKSLFETRSQMSSPGSSESHKVEMKDVDQPDCGLVPKAETLSLGSDTGLNEERRRILFCDVCQVPFTGIESEKQHYDSDKHKKKVRVLEQQKQGEAFPLQCEICNSSFNGQESAKAHFNSDKHKKKASTSLTEGSALSCDACNCSFSGPENAAAHFASEKHKKKVSVSLTESSALSCDVCNCSFSGPENAAAHFASEKHKKKVSVSLTESSALSCDVCNCPFTGPESAAAHFASEKHKKKELKAKSDALEESLLSCAICKCPFSSEENAKQHYAGKKHKKALAFYEESERRVKANLSSNCMANNEGNRADDREGNMVAISDDNIAASRDSNNTAQSDGYRAVQGDHNHFTFNAHINSAQSTTETDPENDNNENSDEDEDITADIERLLLGEN